MQALQARTSNAISDAATDEKCQASQRTRRESRTVVLGEPLYSQRKIRQEDNDKCEIKAVPHL